MCYSTIFTVLYSKPLFCSLGCCLLPILAFLPFCTWSKSFTLFISSKTFSVPSSSQIFGPTLVHVHHLIFLCSCGPLALMISCIISSSSIPLMNCFFEPSILFFVITLCCFYMECTHPLLCRVILFSVQFEVL